MFRTIDGKSSLRDAIWFSGKFSIARASYGPRIASHEEVEARAVLLALTKVSGHGFSRAHVFSNAVRVVNDISGKEVWSINSIILNIHCMLFFCLDLYIFVAF